MRNFPAIFPAKKPASTKSLPLRSVVAGEKGELWEASQDEPLPTPCWMQRAIVGGAQRSGHRDHCGEAGRGFSAALGACVSQPSAAAFAGTSLSPELRTAVVVNLTGGAGTILGRGWGL